MSIIPNPVIFFLMLGPKIKRDSVRLRLKAEVEEGGTGLLGGCSLRHEFESRFGSTDADLDG